MTIRSLISASHFLASLILVTASLIGFSNESFAQRNAKYAGEFLSLGVGSRSAGLGGAGTGYSNDVTAGYFNPSALSEINFPQIAIFHDSRFSGLFNYDYAAVALPISNDQTVSLSAIRFGYGEIKDTRNALIDRNGNGKIDEDDRIDPALIEVGSAADWAFIGSYARTIDEKLSVGGNVKIMHRTVLDNSAWGVGIDLSATYRPVENLMLGAMLADATKSLLAWDTGNQEFIVPTLRLGAAYRYEFIEDHSIMPVIDGAFRFEGREEATMLDLGLASLDIQSGLEYGYKNKVFVRAGYSDVEQLTVGAGFKLPKLNIDYAFTQESSALENVGATHRISLMLTLDDEKFARPE